MVQYAIKIGVHDPYSIPNKGPTPKIDKEENLAEGTLDIAWVEDWRKNIYHWNAGLKWFERLHAHATMSSARRNVKCKRPFAPKDELDFVLGAAYCPYLDAFSEKTDPYLQVETVFKDDMRIELHKRRLAKEAKTHKRRLDQKERPRFTRGKWEEEEKEEKESWRVLRNRVVIFPDRPVPKDFPIKYSNGGVERRENIYNVKLGIRADHSPQTNPGYSRTPCGAFYSI